MGKERWEEGGQNKGRMNNKSMGGFCLLSCQFEIRVVGGAAIYHSKKGRWKIEKNKLY